MRIERTSVSFSNNRNFFLSVKTIRSSKHYNYLDLYSYNDFNLEPQNFANLMNPNDFSIDGDRIMTFVCRCFNVSSTFTIISFIYLSA